MEEIWWKGKKGRWVERQERKVGGKAREEGRWKGKRGR